jgi:hypothetical protein
MLAIINVSISSSEFKVLGRLGREERGKVTTRAWQLQKA